MADGECVVCVALAKASEADGVERRCDCGVLHPRPEPRDEGPSRAVRRMVGDLLEWDRAMHSAERAAGMERSNVGFVLESLRLGHLGTGCTGTKGVGRAPQNDPEVLVRVNEETTARYRSLAKEERETADALVQDGAGWNIRALGFPDHSNKTVSLTLAQRVTWLVATNDEQAVMRGKLLSAQHGERLRALDGMECEGTERLERAATAWGARNVRAA